MVQATGMHLCIMFSVCASRIQQMMSSFSHNMFAALRVEASFTHTLQTHTHTHIAMYI